MLGLAFLTSAITAGRTEASFNAEIKSIGAGKSSILDFKTRLIEHPRDTKPSTVREHLDSNATTEELNTIDNNQTQTVVISEQCSLTNKIDLNTFEEHEPTVDNTVTTEELNIDWG